MMYLRKFSLEEQQLILCRLARKHEKISDILDNKKFWV